MSLGNASAKVRNGVTALFAKLRGDTGRAVGTLVKGTVMGHLITALAMPVLTRVYAPADFSVAQVFTSLTAILIAVSCLRFDMAIPLPAERRQGFGLLILSMIMTLCVSGAVVIFMLLAPPQWFDLLNSPRLLPYLPLVPVAVAFGGAYQAMQMWFVREKRFEGIARSRVLQSSAMAGGQIGLGVAGLIPFGLIGGQLLNQSVGFLSLFGRSVGGFLEKGFVPGRQELISLAREYGRFPKFLVWEALANAASLNLPLLVIGAFASGSELGYLTLATFMIQMPMALIGNAVGQAYMSAAATADRNGELGPYTWRILRGLTGVAIAPIIAVALLSPFLFPLVFGSGWERSGWLVTWMAPWCFFQLLVSPISGALYVRHQLKLAMALQVFGLVLRVSAVVAAGTLASNWISEIYALSGAVFYSFYLWIICRSIRTPPGATNAIEAV